MSFGRIIMWLSFNSNAQYRSLFVVKNDTSNVYWLIFCLEQFYLFIILFIFLYSTNFRSCAINTTTDNATRLPVLQMKCGINRSTSNPRCSLSKPIPWSALRAAPKSPSRFASLYLLKTNQLFAISSHFLPFFKRENDLTRRGVRRQPGQYNGPGGVARRFRLDNSFSRSVSNYLEVFCLFEIQTDQCEFGCVDQMDNTGRRYATFSARRAPLYTVSSFVNLRRI